MILAVSVEVECLRCGTRRVADVRSDGCLEAGTCRRCGDVGWARPDDLSDTERLAIRSLQPPEGRRP